MESEAMQIPSGLDPHTAALARIGILSKNFDAHREHLSADELADLENMLDTVAKTGTKVRIHIGQCMNKRNW